ncbi:hypothetical protein PR048_031073 [Dryococelus australis]|uniref:Uncharacterized protein n=1 Tax=Dryococelus australis TaxID=614101 RepID=A0ABQ9G489_9NEOP|nr:hypothetical protein PR048_031073 [Dryococelus australis]
MHGHASCNAHITTNIARLTDAHSRLHCRVLVDFSSAKGEPVLIRAVLNNEVLAKFTVEPALGSPNLPPGGRDLLRPMVHETMRSTVNGLTFWGMIGNQNEVLTADEGEMKSEWSSAGTQGLEKRRDHKGGLEKDKSLVPLAEGDFLGCIMCPCCEFGQRQCDVTSGMHSSRLANSNTAQKTLADQRHRPARFPLEKILSDTCRGLNPVRPGRRGGGGREQSSRSATAVPASYSMTPPALLHVHGCVPACPEMNSQERQTCLEPAGSVLRCLQRCLRTGGEPWQDNEENVNPRYQGQFPLTGALSDIRPVKLATMDGKTSPDEVANQNTVPAVVAGELYLHLGFRSHTCMRSSDGAVVRALASHHGDPGSIPGGLTPRFSHVGIVLDDAACRRVLSGHSRFPRPCIPAPLQPRVLFPVMSGDGGHLRVPAGKARHLESVASPSVPSPLEFRSGAVFHRQFFTLYSRVPCSIGSSPRCIVGCRAP